MMDNVRRVILIGQFEIPTHLQVNKPQVSCQSWKTEPNTNVLKSILKYNYIYNTCCHMGNIQQLGSIIFVDGCIHLHIRNITCPVRQKV